MIKIGNRYINENQITEIKTVSDLVTVYFMNHSTSFTKQEGEILKVWLKENSTELLPSKEPWGKQNV